MQPVGEIERPVAHKGRVVEPVATLGRVEERLVAGHTHGLCQQVEKRRLVGRVLERYTQLEVADGTDAELIGGELAVYYALRVLYHAEAHRLGRTRRGVHGALQRKDEIRRRDAGIESIVYIVAENRLIRLFHYDPAGVLAKLKSISERGAVIAPALRRGGGELPLGVLADKPLEAVEHNGLGLRALRYLRVKALGLGLYRIAQRRARPVITAGGQGKKQR